jgi:Immunity protein 53
MEMPRDVLGELQVWFRAHCDGDWEHSNGLSITTLDNPGWSIEIQLSGTELESRSFPRHEDHRSVEDWIVCWQDEMTFRCACGPLNLTESIAIFLDWAASAA